MAISLINDTGSPHGVHHDLESCYWVLVWVVVRHVAHGHELGSKLCSAIFNDDNGKMRWLMGQGMGKDFTVPGNSPLTDLLRKLTVIVAKHVIGEDLDYEEFLAPFEEALARDGWPVGDEALSFQVPDLRTNTVGWPVQPPSDGRQHHRPKTEATGSKRKTNTMETVHEDLSDSDCYSSDHSVLPSSEEAVECALLAWREYDDHSSDEDESSPVPFSEAAPQRRSVRRKITLDASDQASGGGGMLERSSRQLRGSSGTAASQTIVASTSKGGRPASDSHAQRSASTSAGPRATSLRHSKRATRSQMGMGSRQYHR